LQVIGKKPHQDQRDARKSQYNDQEQAGHYYRADFLAASSSATRAPCRVFASP
jgi:hypothetical protein